VRQSWLRLPRLLLVSRAFPRVVNPVSPNVPRRAGGMNRRARELTGRQAKDLAATRGLDLKCLPLLLPFRPSSHPSHPSFQTWRLSLPR